MNASKITPKSNLPSEYIPIIKTMKNIRLVMAKSFAGTANEFIDRARAAQDRQDYIGMVINATEAIKREQNNPLAYFLRSAGYSLQGKYAEAIADAAEVIEIDPQIAAAYFLRGDAVISLRPDDWKIALADFDKAIALDPTSSEFFVARARIHRR
jgi:tetratricopeptide (TPR) repeat protein